MHGKHLFAVLAEQSQKVEGKRLWKVGLARQHNATGVIRTPTWWRPAISSAHALEADFGETLGGWNLQMVRARIICIFYRPWATFPTGRSNLYSKGCSLGKRVPNLWRVGPMYGRRSDALIVEDETWFGEQKKLFWVAATDMLQLWSHSLF